MSAASQSGSTTSATSRTTGFERFAASFVAALENSYPSSVPIIVVTHQNCAKALGQLLSGYSSDWPLTVIDELAVETGEYLDVGEPIAHGETVPAVVKTLVFGS